MPVESINGFNFSFARRGAGIPVVLLHGFPLDNRTWDDQVANLQNHQIIAPDLRGFGKSIDEQPFSIDSLADDVHALLKTLGALPCVLGGLSMGGYVALAFAKKYCSNLIGLILTDTRATPDTIQGRAARDAMVALVRNKGSKAVAEQMLPKMMADATLAPAARAMMEACPALTIEHACVAMRDREDFSDVLTELCMPTLIIVGESDQITPPSMAELMHGQIAGSKLVTISGAGHLSPMERPREVTTAITDFLQSSRR